MRTSTPFVLPRLTNFVKKLIITLMCAFVAELLLENFAGFPVISLLALNPSVTGIHTLWQLVTYVLVEPPQAVFSMLIGLLFLWWILSPFEMSYGARRTAQLSLAGTLAASLAALLVGAAVPSAGGLLMGSHPISYAGIAAMAELARGRQMSIFGVVSMTTNQLLLVLCGISVLLFLATKNLVVLAGSLAAIGAGVWFVRWMRRPRAQKKPPKRKRPSGFKVIEGGRDEERPKWLN